MELTSFSAQNFQRIHLVELSFEPGGGMTIIGGKNRSGKSSLLDGIVALIGGPKQFNSTPVRQGADKAVLSGVIGDLHITRTIKPDGSQTLKVVNAEGMKPARPQEMLSSLLALVSLDPLEIMEMNPKQLVQVLRDLTGVDTSEIDGQRKKLYEERTGLGRDGKILNGQLGGLPHHERLPERPDVAGIAKSIENVQAHNAENDEARSNLAVAEKDCQRDIEHKAVAESAVAEAELALTELKNLLQERTEEVAIGLREAAAHREGVSKLADLDDSELRAQLANAQTLIDQHAANDTRAEKAVEVQANREEYEALTAQMDELDQKRTEMLSKADMPVEGLDFGDDGVTLNGVPWDMASGEEGFDACIDIGLALNPRAKFMISKHGGKELDEENLERVGKKAAARGLRLIVERPGNHDENVIEIADGYVVGEEPEQEVEGAS